MEKSKINDLLTKPLWQLSGEEYVRLHAYACSICKGSEAALITKVTGVRALSEYLSCCESTVYMLKREGVLNNAIISRIGKNIVFDAEMARILAEEFKNKQKSEKKDGK